MNTTLAQTLTRAIDAYRSRNFEAAEAGLLEVLATEPDNPSALIHLGLIVQVAGRHRRAVDLLRRGLSSGGGNARIIMALGNSLTALGNTEQAHDCFRKALAIGPELAPLHYYYGKSLEEAGEFERAIASYRRAIRLQPDLVQAHCNLGLLLLRAGAGYEAIEILETAVAIAPDHAVAHYNLAMALLTEGHLEKGWSEYEWRRRLPDDRVREPCLPDWQGEDLTGKVLLIYAEQGVGDEVMFAACIPLLNKQGAKSIYLECDTRLQPLFARSFEGVSAVGNAQDSDTNWVQNFPGADRKVPIASLPRFFLRSEGDFPRCESYLRAAPQMTVHWRRRYEELGPGLKVGISWRGGARESDRVERSTALSEWLPILRRDARFINLQYGACSGEIEKLSREHGISLADWPDANPLKDLDEFAARVAALDLVISIDNATVHFGGALGVPVWTLLAPVPEFRWMREREDSPWYPLMRLFRRGAREDRRGFFERVGEALQARISGALPT